MDWIHSAWMGGAFLLVFGCAELMYHKMAVQAEVTRKFVHVTSGLLTFLFPLILSHFGFVLFLCASFGLILTISEKRGLLPSIHAVGRKTRGSVLFTVAVFMAFLFYQHQGHLLFYMLPIGIMAICDPLAALIGKKTNWVVLRLSGGSKTLGGSITFFLTAVALATLLMALFGGFSGVVLLWCVGLALVTAMTELVSQRGTDNVFVPLAAMVYMYFLPLAV